MEFRLKDSPLDTVATIRIRFWLDTETRCGTGFFRTRIFVSIPCRSSGDKKKDRPKAVPLEEVVSDWSLVRRFSPIELVVHADQDSGRFRVCGEGTTSRTGNRGEYRVIVVAEIHVVAFQKSRPVRREHPFNAATGRPA